MRIFSYFVVIVLIFLNHSCSKKEDQVTVLKEKNLETQMIEVYQQAMEEFERGDVIFAGKKFNEVELIYPQSKWASKSVLMAAYGYFSQGYYSYAINELERFIIKYQNHSQIDYAYYLLALCHYDQIVDEKKDLNEILKAKKYFNIIINNYPNTDYAIDSKYKLEFITEIEASKEMYLARYYIEREKWIPAINRFKVVVEEYDRTIYIEEALHRLVELHYRMGLVEEAEKYAVILGYNYGSSKWYEESYKILNKNYVTAKKEDKDQRETILKKFRNLFK
tara:strand:- start:110 stop:946 length:837 start_codon:yes stop_codon:yes gene_type:complete